MKKQFFYAAAAVALLASCSNDVESGFSGVDNPEGREVIKVGVNAVPQKQTRGTGTVGGVSILEDGKEINNVWHGQDIYVMMFDQNTLKYATEPDAPDAKIYYNVLFKAPGDDGDMQHNFFVSDAVQSGLADAADHAIKYYPQAGNFDFWGYRVDDAAADAQGAPIAAPDVTGSEQTIADAEDPAKFYPAYYTVNFKIDGSQDLMTAKAEPTTEDITKLDGEDNKYRAYSAYAARRGVQPNLKFKHLLSRFEFGVMAGNAHTVGAVANVAKPAGDRIDTDVVLEPNHSLADAPKPEPGVEPVAPEGEEPADLDDPATEPTWAGDVPLEGDESYAAYTAYLAEKAKWETNQAWKEYKVNHLTWQGKKDELDAWNAEKAWLDWHAYNNSLAPKAEFAVNINKITLVSKTTGKMLVAKYPDESLTDAGIEIPTDLTWSEVVAPTFDEGQNPVAGVAEGAPAALELKQREVNDTDPDNVFPYYNKPMVDLEPYTLNDTTKYDQIGEALLVAPGETLYEGVLYYSQKVPVKHDHVVGQDVTYEEKEWKYPFKIYASQIQKEKTHQSTDTNAGLTEFLPGQTYYVYIKMYGAEKIDIITTLTPWEVGGHIDLDPEDETNQQEPTPTPEP